MQAGAGMRIQVEDVNLTILFQHRDKFVWIFPMQIKSFHLHYLL